MPGRPAPKIISRAALERMRPGSVVVDIAAEQGGNCELTRAGETIEHQGVRIVGALNLPAALLGWRGQIAARNLCSQARAPRSRLVLIDWNDEVFAQSCLTRGGAIKHEPTLKALEGAR